MQFQLFIELQLSFFSWPNSKNKWMETHFVCVCVHLSVWLNSELTRISCSFCFSPQSLSFCLSPVKVLWNSFKHFKLHGQISQPWANLHLTTRFHWFSIQFHWLQNVLCAVSEHAVKVSNKYIHSEVKCHQTSYYISNICFQSQLRICWQYDKYRTSPVLPLKEHCVEFTDI